MVGLVGDTTHEALLQRTENSLIILTASSSSAAAAGENSSEAQLLTLVHMERRRHYCIRTALEKILTMINIAAFKTFFFYPLQFQR